MTSGFAATPGRYDAAHFWSLKNWLALHIEVEELSILEKVSHIPVSRTHATARLSVCPTKNGTGMCTGKHETRLSLCTVTEGPPTLSNAVIHRATLPSAHTFAVGCPAKSVQPTQA